MNEHESVNAVTPDRARRMALLLGVVIAGLVVLGLVIGVLAQRASG